MEKTIKIGKEEVKLNNNVAWTLEYRNQFGKDVVPALMPVVSTVIETAAAVVQEAGGENVTLQSLADALSGRVFDILLPVFQTEFVDFLHITWAMAKAADPEIESPEKWLRNFEEFPLDVIVPEVAGLIAKGFVSSKNLKRLKASTKNLTNLQPLHSTKSSSPESSEG